MRGQTIWGYINAFAGAVTALLAPFLGAIADKVGRRKPWIGAIVGRSITPPPGIKTFGKGIPTAASAPPAAPSETKGSPGRPPATKISAPVPSSSGNAAVTVSPPV